MLPKLDDVYENLTNENKEAMAAAVFKTLTNFKQRGINKISLGDLFLDIGYSKEEIDPEDYMFVIDLTKLRDANYLEALLRDKLE